MAHEETYAALRNAVLSRHFALGRFWRANLFTNVNVLGEISEREFAGAAPRLTRRCGTEACVPRRQGEPLYRSVSDPNGNPGHGGSSNFPDPIVIPDVERWRVWYHDRGNALCMTGLRSLQLCVEHRLGQPLARRIIKLLLETTGSLFKWPADSDFGGYILRWDPATDDLWEVAVDGKGVITPTVPCHFPLNSRMDGKESFLAQRYLYCIPLTDPRYDTGVHGRDQYRRYEPSKDEYVGLLTGYLTIFNTFVDDPSQEGRDIIRLVTDQTRRVATYLQRFGYLIVRPRGGVAIRGCGEIFPLLEFPLNRVFKRILGSEFPTAFHSGVSAYQRAFNDALGIDALYPLHRTVEFNEATHDDHGHEAVVGLGPGNLIRPFREKAFRSWMSAAGSSLADGFKPYLALLLLGAETDGSELDYLDLYLTWYSSTFLDASGPAPPDLVDGPYDWTLATVAALLTAQRFNNAPLRRRLAVLVQRDLDRMAAQLRSISQLSGSTSIQPIAVSGASSAAFSEDTEGMQCADHPSALAAEVHDKQGNWYGYTVVVALAWQHLLDGAPNEFANVAIPPPASVAAWPAPSVPGAVIKAAHVDRMPVPLNAISSSTPHPRADSADLPLFDDPSPPKPADNTLGAPPPPQGEIVSWECAGATGRSHHTKEFPYPALVAPAADVPFWKPVPAFNEQENTLVREHRFWVENNALKIEVHLRGVQVHLDGSRTFAKLRGTYSLAWVWSVV